MISATGALAGTIHPITEFYFRRKRRDRGDVGRRKEYEASVKGEHRRGRIKTRGKWENKSIHVLLWSSSSSLLLVVL